MLTPRENFLETIKKDGHPDRIVCEYEALAWLPGDPVMTYVFGRPHKGMEPLVTKWGVTKIWPEDQVAAIPDHTKPVITDITCWREQVTVPDLSPAENDEAGWAEFQKRIDAVDRTQQLTMAFFVTGVFEQLHSMMGFEDTLMNFLLEPDDMMDLCEVIGDYRLEYLRILDKKFHPDVILSHDDWGSKTSLFMSPETWREFLKPQYKKLYDYAHEHGIIVMHHADSFLQPIVSDMAEIGVDLWQGVLPDNDIPAIQKELDGKMALMGGIETVLVDSEDATEEQIRTETRRALDTYTPAGHFIPSITYGDPTCFYPKTLEIIRDEIRKYNTEKFGIRYE